MGSQSRVLVVENLHIFLWNPESPETIRLQQPSFSLSCRAKIEPRDTAAATQQTKVAEPGESSWLGTNNDPGILSPFT